MGELGATEDRVASRARVTQAAGMVPSRSPHVPQAALCRLLRKLLPESVGGGNSTRGRHTFSVKGLTVNVLDFGGCVTTADICVMM